jgi:hypothetical protein
MSDRFADDPISGEKLAALRAKQAVIARYNLVSKAVEISSGMLVHREQGVCLCDDCERAPRAPAISQRRIVVKKFQHDPLPIEVDVRPGRRRPASFQRPLATPKGIRVSKFLLRVLG